MDVLINNAGVSWFGDMWQDGAVDLYDRVLAINLRGPYLCARYATILAMQPSGKGTPPGLHTHTHTKRAESESRKQRCTLHLEVWTELRIAPQARAIRIEKWTQVCSCIFLTHTHTHTHAHTHTHTHTHTHSHSPF